MHKAVAYQALARELERWSSTPVKELIASVGKRQAGKVISVNGQGMEIEVALSWHDTEHSAVRVTAAANGPSHWRLERLEESIVVQVSAG